MKDTIIKLAYRHVITSASKTAFEKYVFEDSYTEFLMQAQAYNPENKFTSLQEMIHQNPKANSLHYKVGFAIGLFIKKLNGIIPELQDTLGRTAIPFSSYEFSIVASDIKNKAAHAVALTYFTDELTLYDLIGEYLFMAAGNRTHDAPGQPVSTFLLKMQPGLSICSRQDIHHELIYPAKTKLETILRNNGKYEFTI